MATTTNISVTTNTPTKCQIPHYNKHLHQISPRCLTHYTIGHRGQLNTHYHQTTYPSSLQSTYDMTTDYNKTGGQPTTRTSDIQKHKQNIWKEHLDAYWDHRHNTHIIWNTIHGLSNRAPPTTRIKSITFNNKITNIPMQHGYKTQHSTVMALHALNNNQMAPPVRTITVALDISKAFDTIHIHTLI